MTGSLLVLLVCLLALIIAGLPIAWSMLGSVLAWMIFSGHPNFLPIVPERMYQGLDAFVLMAVPLFVLAGEIVSEGRITERLVALADALFGWMRGGLAQVNIGASILFAGITGIALGDIAALGRVFIPAMTAQGYSSAYAAAVTASSSIVGPMVPPSLIIIIYGSMTGVSIAALFLATLLPGLLIGLALIVLVAIQARLGDFPRSTAKRSPTAIARLSGAAALPMMIPVIVLGGILGGVMTPTEAGGVAAIYALALAVFLYRSIDRHSLAALFNRSAIFSAQLLIIVGCGAAFSWALAMENVPGMLAVAISGWGLGDWQTLLLFNTILLLLGMFIDPTAVIILFGPLLSHAALHAGIDPLHFGVIAILNLNIGLLTPPLGVCLFAAEKIADCGLGPLLRALAPFLLLKLAALAAISALPVLSLWLPQVAGLVD